MTTQAVLSRKDGGAIHYPSESSHERFTLCGRRWYTAAPPRDRRVCERCQRAARKIDKRSREVAEVVAHPEQFDSIPEMVDALAEAAEGLAVSLGMAVGDPVSVFGLGES